MRSKKTTKLLGADQDEFLRLPTVKPALLQKEMAGRIIQCSLCERRCTIYEGSSGFCKTRVNIGGRLYTLVYGDISSISANPIEKKPFYHFWPGSVALTVGGYSCNYTCPWCLNPSTKVFLNEGRTVPIGKLENCWKRHEIVTCKLEDKTLSTSKIVRYFRIDPRSKGLRAFKIITKETGREVVATEDHPFYTPNGYSPLKDLRIGDEVAVYPVPELIEEEDSPQSDVIVTEDQVKDLVERYIPRSDKTGIINVLMERSLLPLRSDNKELLTMARLLGHLFGDGYLTLGHQRIRDSVSTVFTGAREDLQTIRKDLKKLGFRPGKVIERQKVSKVVRYGKTHIISGETVWMQCNSKPLWVLMVALGAPVGDKAASACHVPNWLLKTTKSAKREFLAAFFGCELSKPRVDLHGKNFFQPRFSLNKLEKLHGNGIEFVHELGRLANEFGVKITTVNTHPGSVRKDGQKTLCIYVLFSNSMESLLNLYGKVGYRYNKKREILARYAFEYLLMKKKSVSSWRAFWRRTLELKRAGVPTAEIIHKLAENGHEAAIWQWVKRPIRTARAVCGREFSKFQEWFERSKLGDEGLVWETIESIEPVEISDARDLTTAEPTHNFFANGFLVSNCQNWHISKSSPNPKLSNYISPEEFVRQTLRERCRGTSISFNEPTMMFEYSLDVFKLAHLRGLYNTFVTNGYVTPEALQMLRDAGLDALCIDVKGDAEVVRKYCGGDVEVVWRNVREAKRLGMHVEVVNLVIPGVNDREEQLRELAKRHLRKAGGETPLHFTAYYPAYKFDAPPTPVTTLERAHDIAMSEGVEFVYIGNVLGHRFENTYCPDCGELLIERRGLELVKTNLKNRRCPKCGREIPIVGEASR